MLAALTAKTDRNKNFMKLKILAFAAALTLATSLSAQTYTITFDDLPETTGGIQITNGYSGLSWNNFYELDGVRAWSGESGYAAGTVSSGNVALNGSGTFAYISSGAPFNFVSAYMTAAWNDNLQVEVQGYVSGSSIPAYDNIYTLSATTPTLINFNYHGVSEVFFISSGGTLHSGYSHAEPAEQFAMDNLTVTTNLAVATYPQIAVQPTVRAALLGGSA